MTMMTNGFSNTHSVVCVSAGVGRWVISATFVFDRSAVIEGLCFSSHILYLSPLPLILSEPLLFAWPPSPCADGEHTRTCSGEIGFSFLPLRELLWIYFDFFLSMGLRLDK